MKTIPIEYIGVQKRSGRALWKFTEEWTYKGTTIPRGFITDGGSIPRVFWIFISPTGSGMKAFCLHDWHYTTHEISRAEQDKRFRDELLNLGLWKIQAWSAWAAVRLFGGGQMSWDAPSPTEAEIE